MAVTAGFLSGSAASASRAEAITFLSQVLYGPSSSSASSSIPMITISVVVEPCRWKIQSCAHRSSRRRKPAPIMAVTTAEAISAYRNCLCFSIVSPRRICALLPGHHPA